MSTFLAVPEETCRVSDGLELFLSCYLQEPIRRNLHVWEILGDPPEPEQELGRGAMGIVSKGILPSSLLPSSFFRHLPEASSPLLFID